jgi:nitrite reductase/ring-hydroxylating ferredoxin subunit
MDLDRRRFVEMAAGLVAAAVLPGCASVAVARVGSTRGELRLSLEDHPQLARPGGYLKVDPDGTGMLIYVLVLGDGGHIALSPICTHLGCTVDIAGAHLVCPCHGSTYDRTGQVLRGPAERRLRELPTRSDRAGELIIQLEGAA